MITFSVLIMLWHRPLRTAMTSSRRCPVPWPCSKRCAGGVHSKKAMGVVEGWWFSWMIFMDDFHGWFSWMIFMDGWWWFSWIINECKDIFMKLPHLCFFLSLARGFTKSDDVKFDRVLLFSNKSLQPFFVAVLMMVDNWIFRILLLS